MQPEKAGRGCESNLPSLLLSAEGAIIVEKFISERYNLNVKESGKLRIDCHLRLCPDMIDFNILTKLDLKALHLDAFDLRDYGFLQSVSEKLEKLVINADTMGGPIKFDCKWLLRYNSLKILWLGKKAKNK